MWESGWGESGHGFAQEGSFAVDFAVDAYGARSATGDWDYSMSETGTEPVQGWQHQARWSSATSDGHGARSAAVAYIVEYSPSTQGGPTERAEVDAADGEAETDDSPSNEADEEYSPDYQDEANHENKSAMSSPYSSPDGQDS